MVWATPAGSYQYLGLSWWVRTTPPQWHTRCLSLLPSLVYSKHRPGQCQQRGHPPSGKGCWGQYLPGKPSTRFYPVGFFWLRVDFPMIPQSPVLRFYQQLKQTKPKRAGRHLRLFAGQHYSHGASPGHGGPTGFQPVLPYPPPTQFPLSFPPHPLLTDPKPLTTHPTHPPWPLRCSR